LVCEVLVAQFHVAGDLADEKGFGEIWQRVFFGVFDDYAVKTKRSFDSVERTRRALRFGMTRPGSYAPAEGRLSCSMAWKVREDKNQFKESNIKPTYRPHFLSGV